GSVSPGPARWCPTWTGPYPALAHSAIRDRYPRRAGVDWTAIREHRLAHAISHATPEARSNRAHRDPVPRQGRAAHLHALPRPLRAGDSCRPAGVPGLWARGWAGYSRPGVACQANPRPLCRELMPHLPLRVVDRNCSKNRLGVSNPKPDFSFRILKLTVR